MELPRGRREAGDTRVTVASPSVQPAAAVATQPSQHTQLCTGSYCNTTSAYIGDWYQYFEVPDWYLEVPESGEGRRARGRAREWHGADSRARWASPTTQPTMGRRSTRASRAASEDNGAVISPQQRSAGSPVAAPAAAPVAAVAIPSLPWMLPADDL